MNSHVKHLLTSHNVIWLRFESFIRNMFPYNSHSTESNKCMKPEHLLRNQHVLKRDKYFLHLVEPEDLLSFPQDATNDPDCELDKSSPRPPI
jgi:hypothetical protein